MTQVNENNKLPMKQHKDPGAVSTCGGWRAVSVALLMVRALSYKHPAAELEDILELPDSNVYGKYDYLDAGKITDVDTNFGIALFVRGLK